MGKPESDKSKVPLSGLFCQQALGATLRSAQSTNIVSREGLKSLLNPNNNLISPKSTAKNEPEVERWNLCISILVDDFLLRKSELAKLNRARRQQIEEFIFSQSHAQIKIEDAIMARSGSAENEAINLFAFQTAIFYFLQVLLIKRWCDLGLIIPAKSDSPQQTLNWQVTSFLKKNSPKGMLEKHDWSFLKQNIFSWYSPSKETLARLNETLAPFNLSVNKADLLPKILESLAGKNRSSQIGLKKNLISIAQYWTLLWEQKAFDMRLESISQIYPSISSGAILLSGLKNGESLNSLREFSNTQNGWDVWAFTDNDLEKYLSEITILWNSACEIPKMNILSRNILKQGKKESAQVPLLEQSIRLPHNAAFAASFANGDNNEIVDAIKFLEHLNENGLLLIASDQFWPSENTPEAQNLRDASLRTSAIRLVIDLRQLTGTQGEYIPKSMVLLEKCVSKEIRDSNRPLIIKLRGHLLRDQSEILWKQLLEIIRKEKLPGDVEIQSLKAMPELVRIESMSAAASQIQLTPSPWITLSDPRFYDVSGRLKRNPSKAFSLGTILKWKKGHPVPSHRAVFVQEREGKFIQAEGSDGEQNLDLESNRFLFLPEASGSENSKFYAAQMMSGPVQFWFRLEAENIIHSQKLSKQVERQSEQKLKLMPLIRLFDPGVPVPVTNDACNFASIEDAQSDLKSIFSKPHLETKDKVRIHSLVLGLDNSIRQNIEVCNEFSKHLFPDLTIKRWNLPSALPEVSPSLIFAVFKHLDQTQFLYHPSIHVTKLRPVNDFKVTNLSLKESTQAEISELIVFHGVDPVIKLNGPSLLLKSAADELQKRTGRPWIESTSKMLFPTDFFLVQTQVKEILKSIQQQIKTTKDCIALLDQTFCYLFGLCKSFEDESARETIAHHLNPEEGRINVQFQKEIAPPMERRNSFEIPRGILQ